VQFEDYTIVLYRQQDTTWVAEIPAIKGCYAVMATIELAIPELRRVFAVIEQEYIVKGLSLPTDTTKIIHTMRSKGAGA
jgi:predicted RNase H-like HicB family nuclease